MEQRPQNGPGEGRDWEREVIAKLATAALDEQRRARRWGIFFKLLLFVYLFILLFVGLDSEGLKQAGLKAGAHTAVVEVKGLIADAADANAEDIIEGLHRAFEAKGVKGVVLRINSPGGSPVQAGYVYEEVQRLRKAHPDIPVHAVIADIGASGAYYIAAAAQNIYANQASIVGSIGVLMNGFGFVEAMEKLGIERRLLTAGRHKGFLDPFSPQREADVEHIRQLLDTIHQQFIDAVKTGRGERLGNTPDLFSGLVWDGRRGVELGLVDGLGDVDYVAREVIGAKQVVDYTVKPDLLARFADRIGAGAAAALAAHIGADPGAALR